MATKKAQPPKFTAVLEFTGTFERTDEGLVFAVCNHAPLVAQGDDEDDALEHMKRVIRLYLSTLKTADQVNAAVEAGEIRIRLQKPMAANSHSAPTRPLLKIVKGDHGFKAEADLDDIAA
jgi:predicted RNase H-like HicB family nuclease